MLETLQRRLNSDEGGFTLIELLVVMIIISILMAVAVPAYLGQKQKAVASQAKSNIKNIADAIESCSASLTNGTYYEVNGATTTNCTATATITQNEPTLGPLFATGGYTLPVVASAGAPEAYTIQKAILVSGSSVTFSWIKAASGLLTKSCTPTNPKVCPTGAW